MSEFDLEARIDQIPPDTHCRALSHPRETGAVRDTESSAG